MPRTSGSIAHRDTDKAVENVSNEIEGGAPSSKLKYISLGVGILIIIAGIYTTVLGVTPMGATDEGMSTKSGCTLVLGLIFMTTGGLFIIYSFKKKRSHEPVNEVRTDLKACPDCQKRVEVDQTLCYHCGHEFG